jgi:hypothetical protein
VGAPVPPPELIAEAVSHPGGSIAAIDHAMVPDPDGYVPPEAVTGVWKIDAEGNLASFEPNPRYGPPQDDFAKLTGSDHWLEWLGDDPATAVRTSVAEILEEQVAGAALTWFKIVDEPKFVTAGRRSPDDPELLIVTRAGMAAPFALGVAKPGPDGGLEILWGVFSVAVVGIDRGDKARSRVWFDLWTGLDEAEQELRGGRLMEFDPAD